MSGRVDADQFLRLPEDARWEILRQLDLTDIARMAETNTEFRDTVNKMFEIRTEWAQAQVEKAVREDKTAMDLQPLFDTIFGGEEWARSFWQDAVMSQENAIMENIQRRLDLRGYGDNPDNDQLWSAIQDMHLLRPERALEWLQKFEQPPVRDRLALALAGEAEPDRAGIWTELPSVTFREFASAVREMFQRRGEFFVDDDGSAFSERTYNDYMSSETRVPGFILRAWADGQIQISPG